MTKQEHDSSSKAPSAQSFTATNLPQERASRHRLNRLSAIAGLGALVIGAIVVYKTAIPSTEESAILQGERVRTIQLDVMNATGESKLAQRLTDYLRRKGFDVVEMGNYREREVEKTLVVDRAGNKQAALRVAGAIGIGEQQVIQDIDRTLYLDVSVIIGKDFKTLLPFQ